jgi:hypothetical protein
MRAHLHIFIFIVCARVKGGRGRMLVHCSLCVTRVHYYTGMAVTHLHLPASLLASFHTDKPFPTVVGQ